MIMGDRIEGVLKCPYCGKNTHFYYAESCGFTKDDCEHCKRTFEIEQQFIGLKLE